MTSYTNRRYLDALQEHVLIFDGAMGTSLQAMKLTAEHFGGEAFNGCNDYLVITYPQAVEAVHRSFLEVGVDAIETNTFRSNRITMAEYGLQDQVIEINRAAAALARRVADDLTLGCDSIHSASWNARHSETRQCPKWLTNFASTFRRVADASEDHLPICSAFATYRAITSATRSSRPR